MVNCTGVMADLGSFNTNRLFYANLSLTQSSSAMHFTFSCPFCQELWYYYYYYYYTCYPQCTSNLQKPATTTPESSSTQLLREPEAEFYPLSRLYPMFIWSCCTAPTGQRAPRVREGSFNECVTLRTPCKWRRLPLIVCFTACPQVSNYIYSHLHTEFNGNGSRPFICRQQTIFL